jgi:hypothetical protein
MPGRDMSSGSYAIRDVKSAFTHAASTLRELTAKDETQQQQQQLQQHSVGGAAMQGSVAAAAAAAVLGALAPRGSNGQPQRQQQQQQQENDRTTFEVVEDRAAWEAVQADGASRSVGNNVNSVVSAMAMSNGNISSSSPAAGGLAATAASREQQLTQGLKQGFGMLRQLVDVVAALGRGPAADAHRSENARQAALRGQARWAHARHILQVI